MTDNYSDILNESIEKCTTFEEISKWRETYFRVQQNSGDNLRGILSDIYSKPTHFMFELLQNADDAKATIVHFDIKRDKIVFSHNGTRDFTLNDIIAITGTGNSTKSSNENNIGKFGVGFKAVFAITKTPMIWSKSYNFKIEDLIIPYKIEAVQLGEWTTVFELKFDSDKYKKDEIYHRVIEEARALDIQTILFLPHIRELVIKNDDEKNIKLEKKPNLEGYTECFDTSEDSKYLVYHGGHKDRVSIAYKLDESGNVIEPSNTNVSVYFPTLLESYLGFVVNAPFNTPRTRETIDYGYSYNPELIDEVKTVFKSSIINLKDLGIWEPDTIEEIMPIDNKLCEKSEMYKYLYETLIDVFKNEKLVLTKESKYTYARKAVMASEDQIAKLLKYAEKPWVEVSENHNLLRSYYGKELGIQTIMFRDFIGLCTVNFLKKQKTKWLYQFYSYCSDYIDRDYRGINKEFLKKQPIIKSRTGNYVPAYVGESQNIFLNSKGLTDARIINKLFTTQSSEVPRDTREKMVKLIEGLDIKSRSPKSTIELDIIRKWDKSDYKTRKNLFFQIAKIYNESSKDEKEDIAKYLSEKDILYTSDGEWLRDNVYQDQDKIRLLLSNLKNVAYIHPDFWVVDYVERGTTQKDGSKKLIRECLGTNELLEAIGVINGLRINYLDYSLYRYKGLIPSTNILKKYGVPISVGERSVIFTYDITDFKEILENIDSPKKSRFLVDELLAVPADKYYGRIDWYTSSRAYYPSSKHDIPAQFILYLNDAEWIFDKEGVRKKPHEVFEDDFVVLYDVPNINKLSELLDFKPSIRKSLPQEDQEKLRLADDFTIEELQELKRQKDEAKDKDIEQDVLVEDHSRQLILDNDKDIELSEFGQIESNDNFNLDPHEIEEDTPVKRKRVEKVSIKKTDNTKQLVGDYGETKVLEYLRNIHNNFNDIPGGFTADGKKYLLLGKTNPGYDIEVSKGEKIVEYIEVKTRASDTGEVVISRNEWDYAKKFGEKYTIYLLSEISKEDSPINMQVIKNPYSKFKEGKILLLPDSYTLKTK